MKDEEMAEQFAEEYVMRDDVITENDRVPFDNGFGWQTVDFEKEVKKGYKDGFLAGLKAGRQDDQLTKAKEIIKDLLEYSKGHWIYSDIKKQAEQFLKEIEK